MELDQLQQVLKQQAQAKASVAGLDERMAEANALRSNVPKGNARTGYLDPLTAISSLFRSEQGQRQAAQYQPMLDQARRTVAEGDADTKGYGLRLAAEKVKRDQANKDRTFTAGRDDQSALQQWKAQQQANADRTHATAQEQQAYDRAQTAGKASGHEQAYLIEDGTPVQVMQDNMGTWVDADTREPVDTKKLTFTSPEDQALKVANAAKSRRGGGGKGGKGEENPFAKLADQDTVMRTILNPLLGAGTGYGPERFAAEYFGTGVPFMGDTDDPERGPKTSALQRDIADIGIDTVKDNLEGLGVNPTDADLRIAFESVPKKGNHPLEWVIWTKNVYRPALEKALNTAIAQGNSTPEKRDAFLAQMDANITKADTMWAGDVERPNTPTEAVDTKAIDDELAEIERQLSEAP